MLTGALGVMSWRAQYACRLNLEAGCGVVCERAVLLQMARSKKACLVFFDEIDAIGGARFDDGAGG